MMKKVAREQVLVRMVSDEEQVPRWTVGQEKRIEAR